MKSKRVFVSLLLILSMVLSGCATLDSAMGDMGQKEKVGTVGGVVGGSVVGAWLGNRLGGDTGALAGAFIGGALGGYLGNKIGESFDARDKRLAKIEADTGIKIKSSTQSSLSEKETSDFEDTVKDMSEVDKQAAYQDQAIYKAVIPAQFTSGSSKLTPKMKAFFKDVAKAYKEDGVRKIMIVGHADNQGDARMNQRLSESRAKAVAQVFLSIGYPSSGIFYQGAGESEPISDNGSPVGRAENRRVEVIDAGTSKGLALAKRNAVAESIVAMKKIKADTPEKVVVTVAKSLSGSGLILPFKGEIYDGQQLLKTGHKAAAATSTEGFFGGLSKALTSASDSLIGVANASSELVIPAFLNDEMAVAGNVRSLDGTIKNLYSPSDHFAVYYNQPIYAYLEDNAFLSLQPVSILKEEALANQMPKMIVYKRYDGKGDKADAKLSGSARLYVSGNKMLYRWKGNENDVKKSGILGVDVLLPQFEAAVLKKTHTEYLHAQIYYVEQLQVKVQKIKLQIKVNKQSKIDWGV